ncbi:MAG: type II toxin-antitoxin system RelE/ParE family toxin [Mesorhizobium sp.]|nr:type II toxin-antitoxin system RelE/ParE family toxin [Mesorhizobium sp.]MCO5163637.1 type II toxin-antitoxin system RelE/ParE family toxin [Mesorhizobium sp.]
MRRHRVGFRDSAWSDLDQIFWYIVEASGNPRVAYAYTRRIQERCLRLADAPHGGRARNDLAPGLRTVPFERSAIICYVVEDDTCWVTNIFHRGRDYEAILRAEPPAETED